VFAPVKDARKRPITAGGFADDAPIVFEDRTARSGLETFRHRSGSPEKASILVVPSGGVVVPGSRSLLGDFAEDHGLAVSVALLVKDRDSGTDARVALEAALR